MPEEYRSGLWEATVDGQANGVASARTCDPPFDKRYDFGGEYAFTSFENMSVTGVRADCKFLLDGRDEAHKLKNVTISGAMLYGAPVKAGDSSCRIGAFTENVVIK